MSAMRWLGVRTLVGLALLVVAGCNSSTGTPQGEAASDASETPPTAAIGSKAAADPEDVEPLDPDKHKDAKVEAPQEGTPEWCLREATRLKLEPPPKTEDVEKLRAHRRERNEKIVGLSERAIAATHKDKSLERVFNVAVHHLLEARLQLAMQGAAEDIDSLYNDAQSLIDRNPESAAAADASFTLVSLAYGLARRPPQSDLQWIREFTKQATFFAATYPKEEPRSVPLLFTAARSCELNGLEEEAEAAYSLIARNFGKNQYAARATTILRRLGLPGNAVQIAGPTLDGGNFALDDLLGKPVLVVFWSTDAKPFETQVPQVQQAVKKHAASGLTVVGINLDSDPAPVGDYLLKHRIAWPQVMYDDAERRGWNHPVANYYGVMEIPSYWLVDADGVVVSTTLTADTLDAAIAAMLAGESKPAARKKPAEDTSRLESDGQP